MKEVSADSQIKLFSGPEISLTAIQASGTRIRTKEYGELIDFESGCWANVLGHSRKEIVQTISENAGLLFHTHHYFSTEHPGTLVTELVKAAGLRGSYKGNFISSGSEAVSLAVSLAEYITKREKKLSLSISYHGTSSELKIPRNSTQWIDLDVSNCFSCQKSSSCSECGNYSSIDFSSIAAFVFEPGNSGGIVLCPPKKLISFLVENTKASGGFVILNEVTTGFGRTGRWFGFQHYDVFNSESHLPDLIALGKGLGNGYPISGVLIKSNLARVIEGSNFRYVQSHLDDPLGCIVARKVVEVISNEELIEIGNKMGQYLRQSLNEIREETKKIIEVRGRGLMNVIALDQSHHSLEVFKKLLERGFFTGYSELHNLIRLYPPLTIKTEEIDRLCRSLKEILIN
ncbi:aminotransferase class III-fold pyridoxal phosphate-dependent enzyme [Alkaliphilus hydrothermalis]|uniref:Acetylornithine aminotransferase n=1 Tax=Alkaliphilus hydrothermalis TaxID=1482730 RepID=A0ABS2NPI7_9FIRM|nr:aminotransferase class III-fold pyridoxal phosphate-dependent enzyme [Alkaliphilus hydrothermalis]MBM7614864.1 acetylornithine aminotransferase [Alkaliphilus hydrothermalis]